VQSAKQKSEEDERVEQAKQQQKERRLKETSNFLKSLVKRKSETPEQVHPGPLKTYRTHGPTYIASLTADLMCRKKRRCKSE
jgi:hypothetical protein